MTASKPRKIKIDGPTEILLEWFQPIEFPDEIDGVKFMNRERVLFGRFMGAERWRWKHVLAWKAAMEKRWGKVWVEDIGLLPASYYDHQDDD